MNNNQLVLFKLIIPAVLFVLWALSQLYNREVATRKNPRTGSPLGPRPSWPTREDADRFAARAQQKRSMAAQRQGGGTSQRRAGAGQPGVVLVDRDPRGLPTAAVLATDTGTRRGGKGGRQGRTGSGKGQPAPAAAPPARPAAIPVASILASPAAAETRPPTSPTLQQQPTVQMESLRSVLSRTDGIREALALQIILGPPVSRRR